MKHCDHPSRRRFLGTALAAAAPLFVPASALGLGGRPGANSRITTAHIGLGPRGRAHLRRLREHAGALCDVDTERLGQGLGIVGKVMDAVTEYRRVLDMRHIDAVVIATPDHWHAIMAVHAMEAGKDVYLESPVCFGPEGARALTDAAAFHGAVLHAALPLLDSVAGQAALRALQDTGPPTRIALFAPPNPLLPAPTDFPPPPASLDWEQWLGPATWRAYLPGRAHAGWRWQRDLGGGRLRHEGVQALALALAAQGDAPAPISRIACAGAAPSGAVSDVPTTLRATWSGEGAAELVWTQAADPVDGNYAGLDFYHAEKRTHRVEGLAMDAPYAAGDVPRDSDAIGRWLRAMTLREDRVRNLQLAAHAATLAAAANAVCTRRLGALQFDAGTGALSDSGANALLREPARGGWQL